MASGIVHARVASTAAVTLTASAAALWVAGLSTPAAAGIVAGALAGVLVTPDADMVQRTHEEARIYRRVGWLAGFLWQLYWMPYAKVFSHRGRSHMLIFGTLTRYVYLLAPLLVLLRASGWLPLPPPEWVPVFGVAMFAAWCVQDALHLVWDAW